MVLLPYSKTSMQTSLGRTEILDRLATLQSPEVGLELVSTTERTFRLVRKQRRWSRVPYLPVITGRLSDIGHGTDIQLVFSIQPVECLILLGLLLFASVLSLRAGEGVGFSVFCLLSYHLGGMIFGFRPAREKGEQLLRRILRERGAAEVL